MSFKLNPKSKTITVHQGDSGTFTLTFWTDGSKTTKRDMSGYDAELAVATKFGAFPLVTLTKGDGIDFADAASGDVVVQFLPEHTDLKPGTYVYDMQITQGPDYTKTVLSGEFEIEGQVAK